MDEKEFLERFRVFAEAVLKLSNLTFGDRPFHFSLIGTSPEAGGTVEMIEIKSTMGHAQWLELMKAVTAEPEPAPPGATLN